MLRANALLLGPDGIANSWIAKQGGMSLPSVRAPCSRLAAGCLTDLGTVRARRNGRPSIPSWRISVTARMTREGLATAGVRWPWPMAEAIGAIPMAVQRIWSAREPQLRLIKTWKQSNAPRLEGKRIDVLGLYMDPLQRVIVLHMDEVSWVHALNRAQPLLPMVKARTGTMAHDSKHHGRAMLFEEWDVLTRDAIGQLLPQRREEFRKYGRTVPAATAKVLQLHLIRQIYCVQIDPEFATR